MLSGRSRDDYELKPMQLVKLLKCLFLLQIPVVVIHHAFLKIIFANISLQLPSIIPFCIRITPVVSIKIISLNTYFDVD